MFDFYYQGGGTWLSPQDHWTYDAYFFTQQSERELRKLFSEAIWERLEALSRQHDKLTDLFISSPEVDYDGFNRDIEAVFRDMYTSLGGNQRMAFKQPKLSPNRKLTQLFCRYGFRRLFHNSEKLEFIDESEEPTRLLVFVRDERRFELWIEKKSVLPISRPHLQIDVDIAAETMTIHQNVSNDGPVTENLNAGLNSPGQAPGVIPFCEIERCGQSERKKRPVAFSFSIKRLSFD